MSDTELDRAPLRGTIWAFCAFVLLAGLWLLLDAWLEQRAIKQDETRLQVLAGAFATALDADMARRADHVFSAVRSPQLATNFASAQFLSGFVRSLHDVDPAYTWIGILNAEGQVLASTGDLLLGSDSSQRPVFTEGRKAPWIGDVHDALMLAKLIPGPNGEMLRFVDFAAPIKDDSGLLLGVLAVHVGWHWTQQLRDKLLHGSDSPHHADLLIISAEGSLLLGSAGEIGSKPSSPLAIAGKPGSGIERWQNGQDYIVAAAQGQIQAQGLGDYKGLGWLTLARKPLQQVGGLQQSIQLWIWPALIAAAVGFGAIGWSRALRRSGH